MRKVFTNAVLFVFAIILCIFSFKAKADHLTGSDMEYTCSNDTFYFTIRIYRDCTGIPLSNTPVNFKGTDCSANFNITPTFISVTDIIPTCPQNPTVCSGGSFTPAIEEHVFKTAVYLGGQYASCCNWLISWQQCCRNSTINTGQADENFWSSLTINRCAAPCNNSPKLSNIPVALLCRNQDVYLNMGAIDSLDVGDSLSYQLVAPMQGEGSQCTYAGSYSPVRPMHFLNFPNQGAPWPGGFRCDPVTGDVMFRPTQLQRAVLAIEVKEWRLVNGVYVVIGTTRRDMQVIILDCNNNLPTLPTIATREVCVDETECIDIQSADLDPLDSVKVFWNRGIPKAIWSNNNGSVLRARGTVCWTPTEADVSSIPYAFTVTARDNDCPINGMNTRSYSFLVKPKPKMNLAKTDLNCGKFNFDIQPLANYYQPSYEYRINGTEVFTTKQLTYQFKTGGQHIVRYKVISRNCETVKYDTIVIDTPVKVTLPADTFLCLGKSIGIPSTVGWGTSPYHYQWITGNPADSLSSYTVAPDTTRMYKLTVTDGDNCKHSDSIVITIKDLPVLELGPDARICNYDSYILDAGNNGGNPVSRYKWFGPDIFQDSVQIVQVNDSSDYVAQITDNFGCKNSDTMSLFVNGTVPLNGGIDTTLCAGSTFTMKATGADNYEWTKAGNPSNVISTGAFFQVNPATTTTYVVKGFKTYGGVVCIRFDTVKVNVNPKPAIAPVFLSPKCTDAGIVFLPLLTNTTGNGQNTVWSFTTRPSAVNGFQLKLDSVNGTGPGDHYITYKVTDNNGCVKIDSLPLTVYPLPVVEAYPLTFCHNAPNPVTLLRKNYFPNSPGSALGETWTGKAIFKQGVNWVFTPSLADTGLNIMRYEYKDNNGCKNADTASFWVKPVPVPDAGIIPPQCIDIGPIDLNILANPYPAGGWWEGDGISGTSIFTPSKALTLNGGNHLLKYSDSTTGCLVTASTNLKLNDTPSVTIKLPAQVCINEAAPVSAQFSPGIFPGKSLFTGEGINQQGKFSPSAAGKGKFDIFYSFTHPSTGCSNQDTASIEVFDNPEINIGPILPICEGAKIELSSSIGKAANGIQWYSLNGDDNAFDDRNIFNPKYTPVKSQIDSRYAEFKIISLGHAAVCQADSEIVSVKINPVPSGDFKTPDRVGCEPLNSNFNANSVNVKSDSLNFIWDFGDGSTGSGSFVKHDYQDPGIFPVNLKIKSLAGCEFEITKEEYIKVIPFPDAKFTADKYITTIDLPKFAFTNHSKIAEGGGRLNYHWDFGMEDSDKDTSNEKDPVFKYNDTSEYLVTLTTSSEYGCTDEVTAKLRVDQEITVFIPNAFTPNDFGPKANNNFFVVADGYSSFNMQIFNRWGELIFESDKRLPGWDGKEMSSGQACQEDVYVYTVSITSFNGKTYKYYGTVTLVR